MFPILQRVSAVANAPRRPAEIPDPRELRRRAFAALRELLARMADRKPMVLPSTILPMGDRGRLRRLLDLLRPPDAPALLLIACFREASAARAPGAPGAARAGHERRRHPRGRGRPALVVARLHAIWRPSCCASRLPRQHPGHGRASCARGPHD
ncbi:MAG: hypothetical protein R3A51_11670 [Nannocystaceae bacterium]